MEEYKAYKWLAEKDHAIIYSKDVTFPANSIFEVLPGEESMEFRDDVFGDLSYMDAEEPSSITELSSDLENST